jgi:hypothetical protein
MTTKPTDYPCTGEPAVPDFADVVEVTGRDGGVTRIEVRKQAIEIIDFYPQPTRRD